ncbi:MAG: helix-turn-helix transcriptional regulator [Clostridiaceae bacterium]|nr:helix-turn-helix transcriptional regulator [Clostridiaceae bacterium]
MNWNLRIAAARKSAGLTQEALALEVHRSPKTVAAWEVGRNEPHLADFVKVAAATNVRIEWLLLEMGPSPDEDLVTYLRRAGQIQAGRQLSRRS